MKSSYHKLFAAMLGVAVGGMGVRFAHADFTPGNLVVVVGTDDLDGDLANDPVELQEFTTAGNTVCDAIPLVAGDDTLVLPNSFWVSHEGQLSLSVEGDVLTLAAYDDDVDDVAPASTAAPGDVPRVVVVVSPNKTLDTSTFLTGSDDYDGVALRQVTSMIDPCTSDRDLWLSGNGSKAAPPDDVDIGGLRFATVGAGSTTTLNPVTDLDIRSTTFFGGVLWGSSGSSNNPTKNDGNNGHNTFTLTGSNDCILTPANGPANFTTQLADNMSGILTGNQSPNFVSVGGASILYISDSTNNTLDKWILDEGGTWESAGTLSVSNIENVATEVDGNDVKIFISTAFEISTYTDCCAASSTITGSPTSLITAPDGDTFYGLAFAPVAP